MRLFLYLRLFRLLLHLSSPGPRFPSLWLLNNITEREREKGKSEREEIKKCQSEWSKHPLLLIPQVLS